MTVRERADNGLVWGDCSPEERLADAWLGFGLVRFEIVRYVLSR